MQEERMMIENGLMLPEHMYMHEWSSGLVKLAYLSVLMTKDWEIERIGNSSMSIVTCAAGVQSFWGS
jgi:hypothetical protein